MIPRGALDIGWRDLASALAGACLPASRAAAQATSTALGARVVYLPVHPRQSARDCARLAALVNEFEAAQV